MRLIIPLACWLVAALLPAQSGAQTAAYCGPTDDARLDALLDDLVGRWTYEEMPGTIHVEGGWTLPAAGINRTTVLAERIDDVLHFQPTAGGPVYTGGPFHPAETLDFEGPAFQHINDEAGNIEYLNIVLEFVAETRESFDAIEVEAGCGADSLPRLYLSATYDGPEGLAVSFLSLAVLGPDLMAGQFVLRGFPNMEISAAGLVGRPVRLTRAD